MASKQQGPNLARPQNATERERDLDAVCPMRRLAKEPPSAILQEFADRTQDMPPDHVLLMKKFESSKEITAKLDATFGDDKEAMLAHLWQTHKLMFRPLSEGDSKTEHVMQWLDAVEEPESNGPVAPNLSSDLSPTEAKAGECAMAQERVQAPLQATWEVIF